MKRAYPALEAVLVLGATLPAAVWLRLPTLWLVVPFVLITLTGRPYGRYGLTWRGAQSWRFHARVCLVVFGPYVFGHYAFARWWFGRGSFDPTLPPWFPRFVLEQFLITGLCEEVFFRGYLQTQLNRWLGRPYRFLGARWGPGLVLAAVLFGLSHLWEGDVARLRVVFFGLFAGWLRERTATIAVPALYHGFSNVLYQFLAVSLR
jgi:membrane protease YdiL (CAAX protease family)